MMMMMKRWSVIVKCDSFFITKCDKCYNKKPYSETIQLTTAILFCFTSLTTFSRMSFGIRTFPTLIFSLKRTNSVSSRAWTALPQE